MHYTEWFGWPLKSSYSVPHSFHRQSAEFLGRRKNIGRWKSEFNPWIVDVLKHIKLWDLNLNHNGYVGWNSMWKKILNVAVYLLFIGQRVLVDNYRGGVYFKLPKIIRKSGLHPDWPTDWYTDQPTDRPTDEHSDLWRSSAIGISISCEFQFVWRKYEGNVGRNRKSVKKWSCK